MGLDIYAGCFVRYYFGDWETIVQQYGRENNMQVNIVRPSENSEPEKLSKKEVIEIIDSWKKQLKTFLLKQYSINVDWDENYIKEYKTDKPDWDGYGAVLLWALYNKRFFKPKLFPKEWDKDKAFEHYKTETSKYKEYSHLLNDVEVWIPGPFPVPFQYMEPGGNEVVIGSSNTLLKQLDYLNNQTWKASIDEILNWRKVLSPDEELFTNKAKFGFSIFYDLCKFSVDNKTPMKLDY